MTLPEIPEEAVQAVLRTFLPDGSVHEVAEAQWAREDMTAAWPILYATALWDFADRMDKTLETIGVGHDPLTAYRFVVGCARELADKAVDGG